MKNRISFAGLCTILCAVLFLFSCSEKTEYLQAVPSDASFVVTFDMKSLSQKGDITNWVKSGEMASLSNALNSGMSEGTLKLWKEIQESPETSGLSFTDNWVCFGIGEMNPIFCILAKISDVDKWKDVVKAMETEGIAAPVSKDGKIETTVIGQQAVCLFTDDKVVFLVDPEGNNELSRKKATDWLTQKKENSLLSNVEFTAFLKDSKDINYWSRIGAMPASLRSLYTSYLPDGVLLGSLYSIGYCDFQNGKIEILSELRSDDKDTAKKLEKIFKIAGKQSGKFLKQIPANALYTVGLNLNGKELYDFLLSLPGLTPTQANAIQSEDTKKIINSIDGDLLFSVTGLSKGSSGFMGAAIPDMALFARVDNDYAVELIKRNLGIFGVKEIGKNRYKLSMGETSVYFGLEDKKNFFVTNSMQVFENLSNGMTDSMAGTPYAIAFDKHSYGIAINMKEGTNAFMPMIMGTYSSKQYAPLIAKCPFTYLAVSGNGMKSTTNIYVSDESKNSFAVFLDWVNVITSQLM